MYDEDLRDPWDAWTRDLETENPEFQCFGYSQFCFRDDSTIPPYECGQMEVNAPETSFPDFSDLPVDWLVKELEAQREEEEAAAGAQGIKPAEKANKPQSLSQDEEVNVRPGVEPMDSESLGLKEDVYWYPDFFSYSASASLPQALTTQTLRSPAADCRISETAEPYNTTGKDLYSPENIARAGPAFVQVSTRYVAPPLRAPELTAYSPTAPVMYDYSNCGVDSTPSALLPAGVRSLGLPYYTSLSEMLTDQQKRACYGLRPSTLG